MTLMGFGLLIVKSIWGAVLNNHLKGPKLVIFLIIAIVIKVVCLFFIWFSAVRKEEVLTQRK